MAKKNTISTTKEVKTFTWEEKAQKVNTALELLQIDTNIKKLEEKISKINDVIESETDEVKKELVEEMDKLCTEKAILKATRKKFVDTFGTVSIDEVKKDLFNFIITWAINPQKGELHNDGFESYYDIAFANMLPTVGKVRMYANKYLYSETSEEQAKDKKALVEMLDGFVNNYIPHEKSEHILTPCDNSIFKLTFAKFEKDTDLLTEREYKLPKNCMSDGYKPMNVHFVDTKDKPMLTELLSFVRGKGNKWSKNGITKGRIDDYAIVNQIFLIAFKYCLDFEVPTTKTTSKGSKYII